MQRTNDNINKYMVAKLVNGKWGLWAPNFQYPLYTASFYPDVLVILRVHLSRSRPRNWNVR